MLRRDGNSLRPHPMRRWDTLAGKSLEVLNGVFGRVTQEIADNVDSFVVGEVGRWFLLVGFAG